MNDVRVVITGIGAITPVGNTTKEFWQGLCIGRNGVGTITGFDTTNYETKIAAELKGFDPLLYMNPKELKRSAPFCQLAIGATKQAIDDSGLDINKEDPYRIGVYIGSGIGGLDVIEKQYHTLINQGPSKMSVFTIPMLIINMAPGQVSIKFGFKGPNLSIATACATGSHSIGEAYYVLKQGEADVMVAGGTESCIIPTGVGGFCACRALSTRNDDPEHASRPFDMERDGFVMGEGAGIVILETLEHAKERGARIYAELAGYAANDDAYHMTAPAPNGESAARCMKRALDNAKMNPEEIQYISAHGTSTKLNDKYETAAVKTVFGGYAYNLAMSSVKSMTGHLLGAAGSVELISCVLAMENNIIPPTINYEHPDPECDLDYVPNKAREVKIDTALNNSLGFGGHNAVIIIKRFKD